MVVLEVVRTVVFQMFGRARASYRVPVVNGTGAELDSARGRHGNHLCLTSITGLAEEEALRAWQVR